MKASRESFDQGAKIADKRCRKGPGRSNWAEAKKEAGKNQDQTHTAYLRHPYVPMYYLKSHAKVKAIHTHLAQTRGRPTWPGPSKTHLAIEAGAVPQAHGGVGGGETLILSEDVRC